MTNVSRRPPCGLGRFQSFAVAAVMMVFIVGWDVERPDTERRPELEPLYEELFAEFEKRFDHDPRKRDDEADALAVDRIVNAVNRLADRAAKTRKASYEIRLPHINLGGEEPDFGDPLHLEVTFTAEDLVEYGVLAEESPSGAPRP